MSLEAATTISQLVPANPPGTDLVQQGDDHIRLIKQVLQNTFPNADRSFVFPKTVVKTGAYTVGIDDDNVIVMANVSGGSFNITLLSAATAGNGFSVSVFSSTNTNNVVTVVPPAGTIDGWAGITLTFMDIATFWSDGSNWHVRLSHFDERSSLVEASVPSAATTDIGGLVGGTPISERVHVTGTTTITSFGARPYQRKTVRFSDVLTLTHNGTSLILPGGANIVTAAGDVGRFVSDGAGNWRCVSYLRASGIAVNPDIVGDFVLSGDVTPALITADQSNWDPLGTTPATVVRFSTDALRTFAGLVGGRDGRIAILQNVGSNPAKFLHESAAATASNRFLLPYDFVLGTAGTLGLRWDATSGRWRYLFGNETISRQPGALVAIIEDQKASGSPADGLAASANNIRTLNTLVFNRDNLVSLSGNSFTLPAGSWEIEWTAPTGSTPENFLHQSFLFNVTDAVTVGRGFGGFVDLGDNTNGVTYLSEGSAYVTISVDKQFQIRHSCNNAATQGAPASRGTEVFTHVTVRAA